MITPMRHITLICRAADRASVLEGLREFGAMHLQIPERDNHDIEALRTRISDARKVLQFLFRVSEPGDPLEGEPEDLIELGRCIEREGKQMDALLARLQREARVWEPFGTIRADTLRHLKNGGLNVAFLRSPTPPADLPDNALWLPAADGFGVAVSPDSLEEMSLEPITLPARGPERIRECMNRIHKLRERQAVVLARLAARAPDIQTYIDQLEDDLAFRLAHESMDQTEELSWIEGFVPEGSDAALQKQATNWGAALHSREPAENDPTPTLLDQNSFVSWIQPVFEFLGVTPGYHEVDVGWSFLIFLSLFSGMIIGDAGYGLLLLTILVSLNVFKPGTRGKFANLLYLMAGATVLWGLLTGNVFGMSGIPAIFPQLSASADPKATMNVCFLLGAGHLTLAHAWNFLRNRRSLQALAEVGWIGSTWTMYAVTGQMVLGWESIPGYVMPVFLVSVALIVLFMTPPAKFKEQWVDHMMLPLSFVNNFVDVVSYVRLYAVGMATFALATSFNSMLFPEGAERTLFSAALPAVILFLGHTLNFILAGMGVMVHGIRLNTLEYASHMGLTWSGIPYSPFRRRTELTHPTRASEQPASPTP